MRRMLQEVRKLINYNFVIRKAYALSCVWIIVYFAIFMSISYHEQGHYQINKNFGVDSVIQINDFGLSGKTVPLNIHCVDDATCLALIQAQSNHETIGYTFMPIWFMVLFICGLVMSIFIFGRGV